MQLYKTNTFILTMVYDSSFQAFLLTVETYI